MINHFSYNKKDLKPSFRLIFKGSFQILRFKRSDKKVKWENLESMKFLNK